MPIELQWLALAVLLLVALGPVFRRPKGASWTSLVLAIVVFTAAMAAAVGWRGRLESRRVEREQRGAVTPREGRPGGYVHSDRCAACHPAQYASWHESFHRTMTTMATRENFKAAQTPATLTLDGRTYRVTQEEDGIWVEIPDPTWRVSASATSGTIAPNSEPPPLRRRLTLITGSHHMQVYWFAGDEGNLQHLFPFSWLIAEHRWVPTADTFLRDPARGHPFQHWNLNCIQCHTTGGQPRPDPTRRFFDTRTAELGIACEACHGPAEQHAKLQQNPARRYWEHVKGKSDESIVNPATLPHNLSSQICGQCHGIKWIPRSENHEQNGFSYRPGDDLDKSTPVLRPARLDLQPFLKNALRRRPEFLDEHYWADGEVRVSGREFNGLVETPCYQRGEMSCLSCHSLHQYQSTDDQLAPDREGNRACIQCHKDFEGRLEEHTHHARESSGSQCYNCHMPHTTYGLLKAIRSHRVSSPQTEVSLKVGRPNACNLCHLDKSLAWTASHLREWYGQPSPELTAEQSQHSAAVSWILRGDAAQRALIAWHMGWAPARLASGQDWLEPYLSQLLEDPYPAVRLIAERSLKSLPGFGAAQLDALDTVEARSAANARVRSNWSDRAKERASDEARASILLRRDGTLDRSSFNLLLQQRDNRSMDLQE